MWLFWENARRHPFFQRYCYFSNIKICSHLILLTHFLSVYFRAPATFKQTSYQSNDIFRLTSIILKWEQPFQAATFLQKYIFLWHVVVWNSYFFLITTSWQQIHFLISYFLKLSTFSTAQQLLCFRRATSSKLVIIENIYFFEAGSSSKQLLFQKKKKKK